MSDTALPMTMADTQKPAAMPRGYWRTVLGRLRHDPTTLVCLGILALIVLAVVFAPLLAPHDPYATGIARRLKPLGTSGYPLGTDELGRCILSRILYGGRVSLFMGTFPVAAALLVGGGLGIVAGFYGGGVNMAIMRVMDVFYAFPSVLLAVGVSGMLGGGMVRRSAASPRARRRRCATWISSRRRGPAAPAPGRSCAPMCWATCWRRSSSTPAASSACRSSSLRA
jgi:peptide/nickel transport system permease protein